MAGGVGVESKDILAMPHFLIGTVDEVVEDLQQRRERYGISYVIVPGEAAEAFAPVVTRLTGA
ncbi:MAG TPA: LLM class F420-dependent oxidoreductase, partial [Candidatus Dormibacteraeota bacterium]|nr:LLM class F420-dependent oxidoreductase [Candidatus Dormibacteraeota bacterium]